MKGKWAILVITILLTQIVGSTFYPSPAYANDVDIAFSPNFNRPFATYTFPVAVKIDGGIHAVEPDPLFCRAADIYIVPKDEVPGMTSVLTDISGVPNTIQSCLALGAFLDEQIGIVGAGGLVTGQYDVIYDEDQDGSFSGVDQKHSGLNGAINIILPNDIPDLPPHLVQLKIDAANEKNTADAALVVWKSILVLDKLNSDLGCVMNPLACMQGEFLNAVTKVYQKKFMAKDPKEGATLILENNVKHYEGLAADPPDPNFMQLTPLEAITPIDPKSNRPLDIAYADAGNAIATEAVTAEALLKSLERYQGADAADDGQWSLIHARAIQNYAGLLAQKLVVSNTALNDLNTAVAALPASFTTPIPFYESFRSQVEATGFTAQVETELLSLELTSTDITDLEAEISAEDYSTFDINDIQTANSALVTVNLALITTLNTLATDMNTVISDLISSPESYTDVHPIADAGGPYAGTEGVSLPFDGTGSTDPDDSIVLYEWDFDRDGVFGDATGSQPSNTFNQAFEGLIGLRVTDNSGNLGIDYAWITIANSNSRPSIDSFLPSPPHEMTVGDTLALSVTTSDPDTDSTTTQWFVDDVLQVTAENFNFQPPIPAGVGTPIISVVVSDNNPLGGEVTKNWGVAVFPINEPPIADAGPDQIKTIGDTVNLDGLGSSDPEMSPLTYSWSFTSIPVGSSATLSDPNIVNPTFVADLAGNYVLDLVVNDGNANSPPDSVKVTANIPTADIRITKTVDNPTPVLTDVITFTVTITNDGPNTATGVQVRDPGPPPGLTGVSAGFTQGSFDPGTGVWTVGTLTNGQFEIFQIMGTVATTNPIINAAELIASDQFDPDSTPNNNDPNEDDQAAAATLDTDMDGIPDATDNCPNNANPGQEDHDNDMVGDVCDPNTEITTNTVAVDTTFGGDLTVDGASFTIPSGITVDFDFVNNKILVKSPSGKILIESGGKIT